jgi:multidrug efflux pump subunit AcrB
MLLSNAAIRNRTTVLVLVLIIVIMGVGSYMTLPREKEPDVPVPFITIVTTDPGVSPRDIENTITNKIEQKLTGLKGMKEITSTSAEGVSTIVVEFYPNVDVDIALQRVKDKVDLAKSDLPQNTDDPVEPVVSEINLAERPIMLVSISGPVSPVRLKVIADRLEDEFQAIPGVLDVNVLGTLEREIVLEVDPDRLAEYGLSLPELLRLIPSENVNQTAGGLETEGVKFNIRVPAEFVKPEEIDKLPLAVRNGRTIYLSDIATVRDTFKDRVSYSRLDGADSITIEIKKRIGESIIPIATHVKAILAQARKLAPAGVKFELTLDKSKDIGRVVADLENNILTGLILVFGVLLLFMGFRSSLIVALAIPLSMLLSFTVLQTLGVTLNMVVLFSLILALGMLVDNAIVIVENIYRYMELGHGRIEAAMEGTAEVAWPVIASTATTVAAFSPLLFWPGIIGDFMQYIPITAIVVLTSSLFVAMVVSPVICSLVAKPARLRDKTAKPGWFIRGYRRLQLSALNHPAVTLVVAFGLLASIGIVYARRGRGVELFPRIDPRQVNISIEAPQGTNIHRTDQIARLVEKRIEKLRHDPRGFDRFDHIVTNVGKSGAGHLATVMVLFPDYEDRKVWARDVMADIRKVIRGIAGADIKVQELRKGPVQEGAVTVRVIGKDLKKLQTISDKIKKTIETVPNLVNLRSDLDTVKPELVFVPDRKRISVLGVSTATISNFLKTAVFGTKVGEYRQFNDEYDIRIRLPLADRNDINDILRLRVPTEAGQSVPISSLGKFQYRPGMGTIHRINRDRAVSITADSQGRLGSAVLADVRDRLRGLDLPAGYKLVYAGEKEEQDKASAFLFKAFGLAMLLIVCILVMQFNTLSVPLIIMTTVILSLAGVFMSLLVIDLPFCIVMTGVGVISLAGVVVNNAIVLLDYTRQLQRRGRGLIDAAIEAGVTRLRPVMLTATTTILGLIPLATGVSFDFHVMTLATQSSTSQWWRSMAWAVIFGLAFATMLTLVVVPALYVMLYRLASRFGLGGLTKPQDEKHTHRAETLEDF